MKKMLTIILILSLGYICFILGYRFYGKGHNYEYLVNDSIHIQEIFDNNKENPNYYFNIKVNDSTFHIQTYEKFNNKAKIIKSVYNYDDDKYSCILPVFINDSIISDIICLNKDNGYFYYYNSLQGLNNELDLFAENISNDNYDISNWIDDSSSKEEGGMTYYIDNLLPEHYLIITNYKGITLLNKKINTINLFTNDIYQTKIDFVYKNKYVIADYTKKFRFHEFYVIDITTGSKTTIVSNNEISFDSYIQGIIDDKVYFFDKTLKKQYEFDMTNSTLKEVGNENSGIRFYNSSTKEWEIIPAIKAVNEEIRFTKEDILTEEGYVKVDKVGTDTYGYYYYYKKVSDKYLVYRANIQDKDKLTYLFTTSNVDNIVYFVDEVYFIDDDIIKYYSDKVGIKNIIKYKELKFNSNLYFSVYEK